MKEDKKSMKLLLSVIDERYPQLSNDEKSKFAKIITEHARLLNKAKIYEVEDLLLKNYEFLVEIL